MPRETLPVARVLRLGAATWWLRALGRNLGTAQEPRGGDPSVRTLPERLRGVTPLVIAGQRGWLSGEIEKLIHNGEAAGWLRFLGFVPQEELPVIYAGARLFVYPSRYEGFGLPVVEAMASGVPVITSSVSCLPEVAGDAADLVHPDDVDGLRISMEKLLEDEGHRVELRARGIERAKRFSWHRCAGRQLPCTAAWPASEATRKRCRSMDR